MHITKTGHIRQKWPIPQGSPDPAGKTSALAGFSPHHCLLLAVVRWRQSGTTWNLMCICSLSFISPMQMMPLGSPNPTALKPAFDDVISHRCLLLLVVKWRQSGTWRNLMCICSLSFISPMQMMPLGSPNPAALKPAFDDVISHRCLLLLVVKWRQSGTWRNLMCICSLRLLSPLYMMHLGLPDPKELKHVFAYVISCHISPLSAPPCCQKAAIWNMEELDVHI